MFGVAPSPSPGAGADAEMTSGQASADTGDPTLDAWADQNLDFPCRMSLQQLDKGSRARILWMVKEKCLRNVVTGNPSAYTQGVIRREMNGTPYGCRPGQPQHTAWQPQPLGMQQAPAGPQKPGNFVAGTPSAAAVMQTIPTPLRAAESAPERPPWVTQAWGVHLRQAALFRVVAANVPAEAMEAIADLPGPWQLVCVQVLLLTRGNYSNPVVFMKTFADMYRGMPATTPPTPTPKAARGNGRPLVVVHLGASSGFELSALQLGAERLGQDQHAVHISELVLVDPGHPWQPVIEELQTGSRSSGPAMLRLGRPEASQQLPAMAKQWQAQDAVVVVAVVVPPPVIMQLGAAAQAPNYHAGPARELWSYLSILKSLGGVLPRLAVAVFTRKDDDVHAADTFFFTKHFGRSQDMAHDQARIPQSGWSFRCCPSSEQAPWVPRRLAAGRDMEHVAPELAAAFDVHKPYTAVLPNLAALEEIVDKHMQGDVLSDAESRTVKLLFRRGIGGVCEAPERLLERDTLAQLFGLNGWRVLDYWTEKMPCAPMVHPFTGQPVAPTFPGGLACGQLRYCPACATFYDCLTSTPSPFVYGDGMVRAVTAAYFGDASRPGLDFAALPVHQCEQGCVGLVA